MLFLETILKDTREMAFYALRVEGIVDGVIRENYIHDIITNMPFSFQLQKKNLLGSTSFYSNLRQILE